VPARPRAPSAWLCAALLLWGPAARGAETASPDWPCIQRKVPEISAGMMWAGPEIDETDRSWQESTEIAPLAHRLAQRRVPIEEAEAEIDAFAQGLRGGVNAELARLFTALLQIVNAERKDIMAGIERYARQQNVLAEQIKTLDREIAEARAAAAENADQRARLEDLERQLAWETRIFAEREQSLTYVCEAPVLLEQRLFALARRIMANLN
jgi:chromosome segregation ATPase